MSFSSSALRLFHHTISHKLADRKIFVTSLSDIIDIPEARDEFTRNSESTESVYRNNITWNILFQKCHQFIIDGSKFLRTKSLKNINEYVGLCCQLIFNIVKYSSTKSKVYLNFSNLRKAIFEILDNDQYDNYHEVYMRIFADYVLSITMYRIHMTPEHYQKFFLKFIALYGHTENHKYLLLKSLQKIIHYSYFQLHLIYDIKKIFTFLRVIIEDTVKDPVSLSKCAYKFIYMVCERIGTEYRTSLCEFSEHVIPQFIYLEDCQDKYELLHLFFLLHHPNGALPTDTTAYAHDWPKWRLIMMQMNKNIRKDIKNGVLLPIFIQLASEVFKQIIEDECYRTDEFNCSNVDYCPRLKRKRFSHNLCKPIDLFTIQSPNNDIKCQLTIIKILSVMIEKYPHILTLDDIAPIMKIVCDKFSDTTISEEFMNNLCKLCIILLKIENILSGNSMPIETTKKYWHKIWHTVVKILGFHKIQIKGHQLLQLLIEKVGVLSTNTLLCLYTTNAMPWSLHSIRTLYIVCQHIIIPDYIGENTMRQEDLVKIRLLQWTINISTLQTITSEAVTMLCDVIINLTSKTWNKNSFECIESRTTVRCDEFSNEAKSKCLSDITRCNLSLEFEADLFTQISTVLNCHSNKKIVKPLFSKNIFELAIKLLHKSIQFNYENIGDIDRMIYNLIIVAKFISNLLDLNIEKDNKELKELQNAFEDAFINVNALIKREKLIDRKNSDIIKVIAALITLYKTPYHNIIATSIIHRSSRDVLLDLFGVCDIVNESETSELNDFDNIYCKDIFQSKDSAIITFSACRALTLFGCFDVGTEVSTMQARALTNLVQLKTHAPTVIDNLWQSLVFMKTLGTSRKGFISSSLVEKINEFINDLFQLWKNYGNGIIGILGLVPYFLEHAIYMGSDMSKILQILEEIYKMLKEEKLGPPVNAYFFKCLNTVVRLMPTLDEMKRYISIIEVITKYGVQNPFFVARLEIVKIVHSIFGSSNIDIMVKKKLFYDIEKLIYDRFIVRSSDTDLLKKDEWNTNVSTALYILGSIIHANGLFQRKALISIFELFAEKKIPINLITKILQAAIKNDTDRVRLIEMNLPNLMTQWTKTNVSLEKFPWILTRSTSEYDFYKKYIGDIILIKLEKGELSAMKTICELLQCSFSEVINNNFPLIMAWLLGQISNTIDNNHYEYAVEIFVRLRNNENEFESVDEFNTLIKEKFADVLINLFVRFHDEKHFLQMFSTSVFLPQTYTPNLTHSMIEKSLQLLYDIVSITQNTLIHFICTKYPSIIQKTLLTLSKNIYQFDIFEYKLKVFHQYAYFSDLLMHEIADKFFDKMALFVIRDVCYTLIHLIQNENNSFPIIAAKYLFKFIKGTLPSRHNEISCILNFLVKNLISIKQSNKIENNIIDEILKFLIIDSTEVISDAIRKLGAFPSHSSFDDIRSVQESLRIRSQYDNSLRCKIEHFLNSGSDGNSVNCSFEDLSHLKQILFENKIELNEMYRDLEKLRGFTEDCTSSLLHKLIYKLVKAVNSLDINISLEAAQCLGELGPADLTTMILCREQSFPTVKKQGECELRLTYRIVVQLIEFLVGYDHDLRQASSDVLYEICASYWGQQVLDKKYLQNITDLTEQKLLQYIEPFLFSHKIKIREISLIDNNTLKCFDHYNEIWCGDQVDGYKIWITNITCTVLNCFENFYSTCLIPICNLNTDFCEIIFPKLIYIMIRSNEYLATEVYKCINRFFNEYFDMSINMQNTIHTNERKKLKNSSRKCVKCMLNVVNFIRIQSDVNLALKLNYLHIAKAAQYCSAYFTSILYAELFCQIKLQQICRTDNISIIDHIYETHPNEGKSLQHILREAYVQIGDPDSIHGCGLLHLQDPTSRMQHYAHVKQWDKVMISQDVELSTGCQLTSDLAKSLRHLGLDYLLNRFIKTVQNDENVSEYSYETAWRLCDWNLMSNRQLLTIENTDIFNIISNNDYDFYHYQALKSLHANDHIAVKDCIDMARVSITKSLRNTSLECSQTLYPKLLKLKMLCELEELATSKSSEWSNIISHWSQQDLTNINDFAYVEPLLTQRIVMCSVKHSTTGDSVMKNALMNYYLELSKCAEIQGYPHITARSLALLYKQNDLPNDIVLRLQYHDAILAWTRNDYDIGRYLMRNLINKLEFDDNFKARVLRIYGNWMAETKSENAQSVIENYYLKSIELANKSKDNCNLNNTHAALAQFADAQYQQISAHMKTPIFESLKSCAEYINNAKPVKEQKMLPTDEEHALRSHKAQDIINVAQYENIQSDQKMYLILAVNNYLMTLQTGENHNFLVFRLVSLWLNNKDNEELNNLFIEHLNKIPSYKFLPLVPQLAPHITNIVNTSHFKIQIYDLVRRCAEQHPHHTLPILFALMNNFSDYEYKKTSDPKPEATERELGAKKLINELINEKLLPIIREMTIVADALIMFAYLKFNPCQQVHAIPRNQKIWKIKNFQYSLMPTITLDVCPSGNYENIVSVYKYDHHFTGVGGVNAPKKIVCIGTDGIERKQLVKGKDDLRQDAVMQQVFTIINLLLNTRKETKRRKLNIRTYKIVPLSQRSGVLEWCDNTLPISSILCCSQNSIGLHKKYYPQDWSIVECRKKINDAKCLWSSHRLKAYLDCCENLHPAFQYFFVEKFSSPEVWFERRLAYVRSVATTSMVGYIIGLGDRHFSNILIDQTTAEVIHIDFGIAFEQGKTLPIPETVPFRLTRDLEAAMGVSGVEGVMRKSCEETMSVLRNRREIIITLLQVLLYAPLFTWTIKTSRARELQNEGSSTFLDETSRGEDNINKIAERALLRIEQKLQGTEDGLSTSVSGQVERLIQEARDPVNLSKLFCGWQAYL